jgi:hypothetical protein
VIEAEYEIEELRPIGRDLWSALLEIKLPEQLGAVGVAQVCRVRVRFSATAAETAEDLLAKAHREAHRVLLGAADVLAQRSSANLLEQFYQTCEPPPSGEP